MALSRSRGNTWEWHYAPGPVIDLVVEDYETIYVALPDGEISKSINRGRTWFEEPVETGLPGIAMLMLAPDGSLFAGGTNGQIAYSTDTGRSFTLLEKRVGSATGDVQVLCDNNFIDNNIIAYFQGIFYNF